MVNTTLTLWGNGAVTLPKKWRERYGTKHFLAKENESGHLVIMPIMDMEYYEDEDGTCGLRFPHGIHPTALIELWDQAAKALAQEKNGKKKRKNTAPRSKRS